MKYVLAVLLGVVIATMFIAWKIARRSDHGVGLVHHIMTKGLDDSAVVGIVVGTVVLVLMLLGMRKK